MSWLRYEIFFCNSRYFNFQCQTCPLAKLLCLSLGLMGYKTSALDFIFSDFLGIAPMFSFKGFCYFIIFMDAHTKYILLYSLIAKSNVFPIFIAFKLKLKDNFLTKLNLFRLIRVMNAEN